MNLKKKNILIRSLIAPYTVNVEHKEHKTKELENKSILDNKKSLNSKETSEADNNASKNYPIDITDFHVDKLVPIDQAPKTTFYFNFLMKKRYAHTSSY